MATIVTLSYHQDLITVDGEVYPLDIFEDLTGLSRKELISSADQVVDNTEHECAQYYARLEEQADAQIAEYHARLDEQFLNRFQP